jgi:hypothetical protein
MPSVSLFMHGSFGIDRELGERDQVLYIRQATRDSSTKYKCKGHGYADDVIENVVQLDVYGMYEKSVPEQGKHVLSRNGL